MTFWLFRGLVAAHMLAGAIAAIAFWMPVIGRKGGDRHKSWGRVFTFAVLATGCFAIVMSLLTIFDAVGMHPHLEGQFDEPFLRGIFGWMMLHNGILTVNLAWYGWLSVRNRRQHAGNKTRLNLALQYIVTIAALNCAWQGYLIGQPLMMGIAVVGVATGATNLFFIYTVSPSPLEWQKEHLKALVGAGISVYTAFFAFGSVRLIPSLALNPIMWAVPLSVGLVIIIYHRLVLERREAKMAAPRPQRQAALAPE